MVFSLPQHWDLAIDGIQIIICLLILFFLIRSRRKPRKSARQTALYPAGQDFNAEMFSQSIKQHVDQAFTIITETIAVEQRKLNQVLPNRLPEHDGFANLEFRSPHPQPKNLGNPLLLSESCSSEQLYEQIQKLAVKGLSTRQIAEELKKPLGEIELVLSLCANEKKSATTSKAGV